MTDTYRQTVEDWPLEVAYGQDDEGPCAFYVRGHDIPLDVMAALVAAEVEGRTDLGGAGTYPAPKPPAREWWRKVPVRGGYVVDARFVAVPPGSSHRGAFPVTVVDVREWER